VNGLLFYRGPSMLDGKPIVAIATGLERSSDNPKTGALIQTWILRDRINPLKALAGADVSICGHCPHRPALGGTCYVRVHQAPLAVWKALKRGRYPRFNPALHLQLFEGKILRLGAYGDPAAVPLSAWRPLIQASAGRTGYTHQWRSCDEEWRAYVMASVDTPAEREEAIARGWRTFRVRAGGTPLLPGEFTCPASQEAGYRITCARCQACDGATHSPSAATPVIIAHGAKGRRFALTVV
jgi:hypothetical protein